MTLVSDQAEAGALTPTAASVNTRILIELQVISLLLHNLGNHADDLQQLRADVARSLLSYSL